LTQAKLQSSLTWNFHTGNWTESLSSKCGDVRSQPSPPPTWRASPHRGRSRGPVLLFLDLLVSEAFSTAQLSFTS
jgi:hypothetical protein